MKKATDEQDVVYCVNGQVSSIIYRNIQITNKYIIGVVQIAKYQ